MLNLLKNFSVALAVIALLITAPTFTAEESFPDIRIWSIKLMVERAYDKALIANKTVTDYCKRGIVSLDKLETIYEAATFARASYERILPLAEELLCPCGITTIKQAYTAAATAVNQAYYHRLWALHNGIFRGKIVTAYDLNKAFVAFHDAARQAKAIMPAHPVHKPTTQ